MKGSRMSRNLSILCALLLAGAWSASEAESAFMNACMLIGQRVRRGLVVEANAAAAAAVPPRSRHH